MKRTRILIAENHPLIRIGLRSLLSQESDLEIVAEASSGDEAVARAVELQPDVILMDIGFDPPSINGVEATRQIIKMNPKIYILIVTLTNDPTLLAAFRAGARGYLLKEEGDDTIMNAIRTVSKGGTWVSPKASDWLTASFRPEASRPFPELTEREYEVLILIVRGYTNQTISDKLTISYGRACTIVSDVYRKLEVKTRGEAIAKAHKAGIS